MDTYKYDSSVVIFSLSDADLDFFPEFEKATVAMKSLIRNVL